MEQKDKELLLQDLCARLPYDLYVQYDNKKWVATGYGHGRVSLLASIFSSISGPCPLVEEIKPYLRPMSSMTDEECIKLSQLYPYTTDAWKYIKTSIPLYIANLAQFDFFHSHHLDWRGLIEKGLALEAPEGMYNE